MKTSSLLKSSLSINHTLLTLLLALSFFFLESCNKKMSISSNNQYVSSPLSNFNYKCYFNYVGAYDYDLRQWRTDHPPYRAITTVVINIGYDGAGQIYLSQYGNEKLTYNVIKSFFMGDYYSFTWRSEIGGDGEIVLRLRKGTPTKLEFLPSKYDQNSSIVYYN